MPKKGIILILLGLLLFQIGGLWLTLKTQQCYHRWEVLEELESDPQHLIRIVMPKSAYLACKLENDEILWKGEMYDVKSSQISGETIQLLAFPDKLEDRILDTLTLLENENPLRKNGESFLHKLTRLLYLPPIWDFQISFEELIFDAEFNYVLKNAFHHISPEHNPPEN